MNTLISKTPINLQLDRNGQHIHFIEMEVIYTSDSKNNIYNFTAKDYAVYNKDTPNESRRLLNDFDGNPVIKKYTRTYEEFDQMLEYLKNKYPSELTGTNLQDYLVLKGSIEQLEADTVYNEAEFEIRVRPIFEEETLEEE